MTPTQEPICTRVPGFLNLTVATGGSYTSAKFMPVIGEEIIKQLELPPTTSWPQSEDPERRDQPALQSIYNIDERKLAKGKYGRTYLYSIWTTFAHVLTLG